MVGKGENQNTSKVEAKINSPSDKVRQGVEKKIPNTWESLRRKGIELTQVRDLYTIERKGKNDANDRLETALNSEDMGPGKGIGVLKNQEKPEEDEHVQKLEGEYRNELKSLYETEIATAGDDPAKKHEVRKKVLEEYVGKFDLDKRGRFPEDIKKLAETLPDAYKDLIMNPETDFGNNLNKLRDSVYQDIYQSERDLIEKGGNPEDVKKELAKNFTEVTGIRLSPEEFEAMLAQQRDSEAPEEKTTLNDKDFATTRPVSTQGFMAGGESYGGGSTSGGGGGWSGEQASSGGGGGGNSGGGGGSSPETLSSTPSEMTTGTYKWQGRSFKMQGPLKDVTPDMTSPALLAKLAKQGVNPGGSTGTCYKSVKNHICAAGYIPTSYALGGGSAKNAGPDLLSAGFQSVGTRGGQIGDVYVYSGGEHGHIEINTGDGFASDFFSSRASGRTLIGVYRPPELKTKGNPAPPQVPQKMMG
ncbi:hypothetical protein KA050_03835 [Candidatus Gracilibacteria bacterium]|nr:hypothetical protein [Candidatus Gracilibacteria bacterium]